MHLARLINKKEAEKWLIWKYKRGHHCWSQDINGIIKKYYKQLYTHKFDNLYEIDAFLEMCQNLHNLNINLNMCRKDSMVLYTYIKEIESIINNFPKQRVPDLYQFTGELYETCKEKFIPILYNPF